MRLLVSPARHVAALLAAHSVDLVFSLISPDAEALVLTGDGPASRILRFNDIDAPRAGLVAPSRAVVETILALGPSLGPSLGREPTILIHCHAGISRSTAAAYALACGHLGPGHEAQLAANLRAASPSATPNRRMIALADELLARDGRMIAAISAIGRGADAYEGSVIDWTLETRPSLQP